MKEIVVKSILIFLVLFLPSFVFGITGDEALQKLLEGNKRFVSGNLEKKDISDLKRKDLLKGQKPFAIILGCSDSRVPPEIIFDQGLGDIFVVRVAGNVVDPVVLRSIEYAAEHLKAPLLFILGHTNCGAVTATLELVEKKGKPCPLAEKISPAVKKAMKKGGSKEDILENAIKENIYNVYNEIMKSKIIRHLVKEGALKIVAGEYNLSTGKVELIDIPSLPKK